MEILEALNWRYATKAFDESRIVPEHQINAVKEAFNLTPTSYGLQPLKLLVISDKEMQAKLLPVSFNQKQVITASHVLVLCIEKEIDKAFIESYFELIKKIRKTPDETLKPFRDFLVKDFSSKSEDDLRKWAINQAYLALGNILTVCALEKIDACPMEGFLPAEYSKILELDTTKLEPVLVSPIGYRHKDDVFSSFSKVRRPLEETVIDI